MIDVIALAREAGFEVSSNGQYVMAPATAHVTKRLACFAGLVQQATAAECADMGDSIASGHEEDARLEKDERFAVYAKHERRYARAIRAKFGIETKKD